MDPREISPKWAAEDVAFRMIDVGEKTSTRRWAEAQGSITMGREAFELIRAGKLPKGNVLILAEVAGIMAAKQASHLIPLCHPLPIDHAEVKCELVDSSNCVLVRCRVLTHAKTGVEMEALAGVSGALLCIYDLTKNVDPALTISQIRLNIKEGGKSGRWVHPEVNEGFTDGKMLKDRKRILEGITVAVITVSDRAFNGKYEDKSGPALQRELSLLGCLIHDHAIVPDEVSSIQERVMKYASDDEISLVVTTGGTGLGPRDVTCEALTKLSDRIIPGFGELLRKDGAKYNSSSWLSGALACLIKGKLVIAFPGNPSAIKEGVGAIKDLVSHAVHILKGGKHA